MSNVAVALGDNYSFLDQKPVTPKCVLVKFGIKTEEYLFLHHVPVQIRL